MRTVAAPIGRSSEYYKYEQVVRTYWPENKQEGLLLEVIDRYVDTAAPGMPTFLRGRSHYHVSLGHRRASLKGTYCDIKEEFAKSSVLSP